MASMRVFSAARTTCRKALARSLNTKATSSKSSKSLAVAGTVVAAAGIASYGAYKQMDFLRNGEDLSAMLKAAIKPATVCAAGLPTSQPSVFSPGKDHALYLWIHLKPTANPKDVAKIAAKLQKMVDQVVDPTMKDEDDEVLAGVGFGPNFYRQLNGKNIQKNFTYSHRKGASGDMPSSGGDVFIHAKSNEVSKLFELCQLFMRSLPKDSVETFEDIYSFTYQNGRDLSGFIDGTENRADDEGRQQVAVEKETGGSYVITQKWIHDLNLINSEKPKNMESWVGRDRGDSTELSRKTISSHVARMTGGNKFEQPKPVEIVRQSMPYGTMSGEAGLFFIGYASDPYNFDFMLDRMVGAGEDDHCDDIMKLTKNVKGTYWYFPGEKELSAFS